MSQSQTYAQELERLIVKTLLPVYEKYCSENNLSVYDSGIPAHLLERLQTKKHEAALFRPK